MAAQGAGGRGLGPFLLRLLELVDQHRGAFEYDWAARFHEPLDLDGDLPALARTWHLADQLARDPSSHVYAAINGWAYPASREALALADLFDALVAVNTRKGHKPKPYPRPWDRRNRVRLGNTGQHSQHTVRAALRARGHDI